MADLVASIIRKDVADIRHSQLCKIRGGEQRTMARTGTATTHSSNSSQLAARPRSRGMWKEASHGHCLRLPIALPSAARLSEMLDNIG